MSRLIRLLEDVRGCRLCEKNLPRGPRPTLAAATTARLLIVGQAPGTKVHETGVPWNDLSGDRLRNWLQMDRDTFYDPSRVAIIPMGFCYPGRGRSGDLPPRPECAPRWHGPLLEELPELKLTLLVGQYAQRYYLPDRGATLGDTVQRWHDWLPRFFPLPHPSPRNQLWLRKRPWFEEEVVPALRQEVRRALND